MNALAVDLNRTERAFCREARNSWPGSDVQLLNVYRYFAGSGSHKAKPAEVKSAEIVKLIRQVIIGGLGAAGTGMRRAALARLTVLVGQPLPGLKNANAAQQRALASLEALRSGRFSAASGPARALALAIENGRRVIRPKAKVGRRDELVRRAQRASVAHEFNLAMKQRESAALVAVFATNPKTTVKDLAGLIKQNPSLGSLSLAEVLPVVPIKGARASRKRKAPRQQIHLERRRRSRWATKVNPATSP